MLGSGSFSTLSSVLGLTIWVLIYAYDVSPIRTCPQTIGFSMVVGLAATLTFGAPAEWAGLLGEPQSRQFDISLSALWLICAAIALAVESER